MTTQIQTAFTFTLPTTPTNRPDNFPTPVFSNIEADTVTGKVRGIVVIGDRPIPFEMSSEIEGETLYDFHGTDEYALYPDFASVLPDGVDALLYAEYLDCIIQRVESEADAPRQQILREFGTQIANAAR